MRRRALIMAAVLAAFVIALAGCGGSSGGSTSDAANSTSTTSPSTTGAATAPTTTSTASTSTRSAPTTTTTTSASSSTPTAAPSGGAGLASGPFTLSSPAFASGGTIPSQYTCDGTDLSPPLSWSGVPQGTKELVLVIRDPDAPGGNFVHWAVAGISPDTTGFPAGGVAGQVTPGRNSSGTLGYKGPCPPTGGGIHHYVITLSALSSTSGLTSGFSADALQTQALGIATLTGTYGRP